MLNDLNKRTTLPFTLYNNKFLVIANFVTVDSNKHFIHTTYLTVKIFIACPSDIHDKLKDKLHFPHRRQAIV
jgi:hypothetical protein